MSPRILAPSTIPSTSEIALDSTNVQPDIDTSAATTIAGVEATLNAPGPGTQGGLVGVGGSERNAEHTVAAFGPTLPSGVPVVQLKADLVTDEVASRLAIGLLGHVLFLKNQIPLPVPQLTRRSATTTKSSTSRSAKARTELLASFDMLTSHLTTTFATLSGALYRSYSEEKRARLGFTSQSDGGGGGGDSGRGRGGRHLDRAYLAVVLGPSLGTAKSRTFMAVDGFEAREWGMREGEDENKGGREEEEGESDEEVLVVEDESESESQSNSTDSEIEEEEEEEAYDSAEEPGESEDELDADGSAPPSPLRPQTIPPPSRGTSQPPPPPTSYAEDQRFLQNSERLLARVLATADAEGYGFASELPPTQTHILLRAPRRFAHPSWIPRQNISASLESSLEAFLENTGKSLSAAAAAAAKEKKEKEKMRVKQQLSEGVWVTAKAGLKIPESVRAEREEDEMIWWSWDGKIVGFSDW
ncbi:hypothetical protein DFP72DRAFT_1021451 [Ephemerocybe angulata]|uniref:Uncharacterized protein n=1 Tax=Ephemerocybe angulata TaxID=980116 RepID=A0A8H6HBH3_9AGAR|nr:hypothetical protein DFP72DRAFT_1021451 [Tulosesus angulatus]